MQSCNQFGEFFLSNYRLGHQVGRGAFGKVMVAEHVTTRHKVAIKVMDRQKILERGLGDKGGSQGVGVFGCKLENNLSGSTVDREIKLLRLLMHPHIIRLYEVIQTPAHIYFIMEFAEMGELYDYIMLNGRLLEEEARRFFQQILSGVEYCHRHMIVHRDLKPENLLLDENKNMKIADFGLSNVMRDGHFLSTRCGSLNYASPEVLEGSLYAGPEVDVWSSGVILYAMLCGQLPFDDKDKDMPKLFKKIRNGIYVMPPHISPAAADLIQRILVVNPMARLSVADIREHPWFRQHLPRYIQLMQADVDVNGCWAIDVEALEQTLALGFTREALCQALQQNQQNEATVAYCIIRDRSRRAAISAELAAASRLGIAPLQLHPPPPHQPPAEGPGTGTTYPARARQPWQLGCAMYRLSLQEVMERLCWALQVLNISWKRLTPFTMRCRATVTAASPNRRLSGVVGSPAWGSTDSLLYRLAGGTSDRTDGSAASEWMTHAAHAWEPHAEEHHMDGHMGSLHVNAGPSDHMRDYRASMEFQSHTHNQHMKMGDVIQAGPGAHVLHGTGNAAAAIVHGAVDVDATHIDGWCSTPLQPECGAVGPSGTPHTTSTASSTGRLNVQCDGDSPEPPPRKLLHVGRDDDVHAGHPPSLQQSHPQGGGSRGELADGMSRMHLEPRRTAGDESGRPAERVVKFEVQVFMVVKGQHALDLQCVEGDILTFMDICAQLLPLLGS